MPKFYVYNTGPVIPTPPPKSTSTPLAGAATWSSVSFNTEGPSTISGSVFTDQPGILYIEQSADGINWDVSTSYDIPTNDGQGFIEDIILPYTRVRYVNGATPQTTFRLSFLFK